MHLKVDSEIEKWNLYGEDQTFTGTGSELSKEAKDYLLQLKGNGAISIISVVGGPDRIGRRVGGTYAYSKI